MSKVQNSSSVYLWRSGGRDGHDDDDSDQEQQKKYPVDHFLFDSTDEEEPSDDEQPETETDSESEDPAQTENLDPNPKRKQNPTPALKGVRKRVNKPDVRKTTVGRASNGSILCDCGGEHYATLCPVRGGHRLCQHKRRATQCNIPPCKSAYKQKPNAERPKCKKCGRAQLECNRRRNCEAYCLRHGIEDGQ